MRSFLLTFLLALAGLVAAGLGFISLGNAKFSHLLGGPPTAEGDTLYDFPRAMARDIYLGGNGVSVHCLFKDGAWQVVSPWEDRADPRILQLLLDFTLESTVEGAAPTSKLESTPLTTVNGEIVQRDGAISVRLADRFGDPLAKYMLGRRTAWYGTNPETGDTIPTVLVQPRDRNRKDYVYAITDDSDIHSFLSDGFSQIRDHHPFLFNPLSVKSVRIRTRQGELVLAHEVPNEPWKITKPLGLQADRDKVVTLLQGLYDFTALRVKNHDEVTLTTEGETVLDQIAITGFQPDSEVVMSIYPPAGENAKTVHAVVSNRPNAVFELPLTKPAANAAKVALNELPLAVNDLRDPSLTSLNPRGLQSIVISSVEDSILISRAREQDHFKLIHNQAPADLNEEALFTLIKTVTTGKVAEFVSDSATELKSYGLDQPFLTLVFRGFDGQSVRIDFGQKDQQTYAIRAGTTTVVRIGPDMLASIPTRLWQWRDLRLWQIAPPDVVGVARASGAAAPLVLGYEFASEKWTASEGHTDKTVHLNQARANMLLKLLLDLQARSWLRPGNTAAAEALETPDLRFEILSKSIDDEGEFAGITRHRLAVATVQTAAGGTVCYGTADDLPNAFLLDPAIVGQLAVDLFAID